MSLAIVLSRSQDGINAPLVTVEVLISNGLPGLSIVGLPETAVKESKDRVRGAIINSNFEYPTRRITINLAPADLPKDGGRFDLPIAIGILAASGQISNDTLSKYEFTGELALTGDLRSIKGVIPFINRCNNSGRTPIIPQSNEDEASLVNEVETLCASNLCEVCAHLNNLSKLSNVKASQSSDHSSSIRNDMSEIIGQQHAKRALEIAAAGGHSICFIGPPGTGKSMLANRLPEILPPMTDAEAIETASVVSISGNGFSKTNWKQRPFRSPHHTASAIALVGGGPNPKPGEISLAHNGVMFLDELPEFDRKVLEVLREPLESGVITISRATKQSEFPAKFQLVAAMNPCPCGYLGDKNGRCSCNQIQIQKYRSKISGPLIDRIDLHVEVPRLPNKDLSSKAKGESSLAVRERVLSARKIQLERSNTHNARLTNKMISKHCNLSEKDHNLLSDATEHLGLSARAFHRILKVARTIADLENCEQIKTNHLTEALSYRKLDRRLETV